MSTPQNLQPCPRCALGRLTMRQTPYTRVHEGLFISVPNVKVYTCDVCGLQEVDAEAMIELDAWVGEFNLPPVESRPAAKLSAVDSDTPDGAAPTTRLKP
jgi:hypothetical protein